MLGGIAMLEKGYLAIAGAVFVIFGCLIMFYSFMAIYFNKQVFKKPGKLLLLAFVGILALIGIQLFLGKMDVAAIIGIIALPVPIGLLMMQIKNKVVKN